LELKSVQRFTGHPVGYAMMNLYA